MAFISVAKAADIKPGAGHRVFVEGRELALFRIGEEFYCLDNSCPHMDGPLCEGVLEGDVVHCPWHFWPINVRTGEVTFDPEMRAEVYSCRVEGDAVQIDLTG